MILPSLLCAALAATAPAESRPDRGNPEPSAPGRRLLDRVVAVLDKQPLLQSDLELETRLLIVQRYGAENADASLTDEDLAAALSRAISYRLALAEAERLGVFRAKDQDSAHLVRAFAERFASEASYRGFLRRHEISETELAALLQRDLRVERYIDTRIQVRARITDEALRAYYSEHQAAFPGLAFQEVRERIRAELARERYPELVEHLLAELRAKAEIRLVAPFARLSPRASGQSAPDGDTRDARP